MTCHAGCQSQLGPAFMEKEPWVEEALIAKAECGLSFDEIAKELGLTNVYTAQMFYLQARCFELVKTHALSVQPLIPGCPWSSGSSKLVASQCFDFAAQALRKPWRVFPSNK